MKPHALLQRYLEGIIKGYSNSLVIQGKAGLGKSEIVCKCLIQAGLKKDRDYIYLANYLTPRAIIEVLKATNKLTNPKILIIDEAEHIFNNLEILGILKSSLWAVDGERKVFWITSKEQIEFNFNGKIIFILNKINKKSEIVNAILDRSLFYKMELTPTEIKNLITERAKQPYLTTSLQQRIKVAEFLTSIGKNLSLRSFPHALNLSLLSPNHWRELVMKASVDN